MNYYTASGYFIIEIAVIAALIGIIYSDYLNRNKTQGVHKITLIVISIAIAMLVVVNISTRCYTSLCRPETHEGFNLLISSVMTGAVLAAVGLITLVVNGTLQWLRRCN